MDKIASALVKAQRAFGPALKTHTNPAFRTKYADLGACVEAVIDALNANGIALIQKPQPCDGGVMVETVFVHESGETMSAGTLSVPAVKQDPQGYGSALTYARRYSLMAACGIAPEDDDGNAAAKAKKDAEEKAAEELAERRAKWLAKWLDEQATLIEAAGSEEELKERWTAFYKAAKKAGDADAIATITPIKDRILAALKQKEPA